MLFSQGFRKGLLARGQVWNVLRPILRVTVPWGFVATSPLGSAILSHVRLSSVNYHLRKVETAPTPARCG